MTHNPIPCSTLFPPRCRRVAAVLLLGAVLGGGCGGRAADLSPGEQESAAHPGLDPDRAFLRLDQIEPTELSVPQPTEAPEALSARGARRIDKARALHGQQRYTEAALQLDRALQSDGNSLEVHRELARVLRAAGNLQRCRTHLHRALEFQPDDLVLRYLAGLVALDDGEVQPAIREWRLALQCSNAETVPDFRALTQLRLAELLHQQRYLTAALELYRSYEQTTAAIKPGAEVDHELTTVLQATRGSAAEAMSRAYEQLGRFDLAAEELARALKNRAPEPAERTRLVRLLSRAGRHDQALTEALELVEADPSKAALLLETHRLAGHPDKAVDDLAKLVASDPDEVRYLLAYAEVLGKLGRTTEAERALRRFSRDHPDQLEVHWRLFDLETRRRGWAEAFAVAADAIRGDASAVAIARSKILGLGAEAARAVLDGIIPQGLSEEDYAASYLLGCLAAQNKETERAEALLGRALERSPGLLPAKIELGTLYIEQYRWQDCLTLLGDRADSPPADARVEWLLGEACAGLDQDEQAVAHFNAAIGLNRQESRAMRSLARLYERTGRPLRAIRQYENLLDIEPLDEASREALLNLYRDNGDREAARAQLDELRKTAASPNRLARCTALLQFDPGARGYEQLRTRLSEAMEESGPDSRSLTLLAVSYLDQGRYVEGLAELKRAVELDPEDTYAQLALEYAYRMNLQFDKSTEVLRRLLRRHPNRDRWIARLVDVLVTDQDFDGAVALLGELLASPALSEEKRLAYRQALAETLQAARRHDEQISTVKRWCDESPEDLALRGMLVGAYLAGDRLEDALAVVESWHEETPDNEDLQRTYTNLLVQADRDDRAFQLILDWLEGDPDNDRLQHLLADRLSDSGRYNDALELAANCLVEARDPQRYQQVMLHCYGASGRHDQAVKLLSGLLHEQGRSQREALRWDGEALRRELARQLIQGGRHQEAQNRLNRWIEQTRAPAERFGYLSLLAVCHQDRGQVQQALETLEQAYRLSPLDPGINNDLAYNWADAGVRLDEAERCLRYAVAQQPRKYAFLDSLGWVLYKKGDLAGATKWLTRATRAGDGDNPVILDHLGDAHWRAGRREDGVACWRAAHENAAERIPEERGFGLEEYRRLLEVTREKVARFQHREEPEVAPLGEGVAPPPIPASRD